MKIINGKMFGKAFYGLHFCEGVAEYEQPEGPPQRIFVNDTTIREMGPTFVGKPVFVKHVAEVDFKKLLENGIEEDGWVVESFFNQADGRHWVKFLVCTAKGLEALSKGWKLSNAYTVKNSTGAGRWHNVEYQNEVTAGEFQHLAIVPNPRYEESIVLTPEEFKAYNSQKVQELTLLANSKETPSMFNLFKKTKVENSAAAELESTVVTLSKRGDVSLKQLINEAEEMAKKEGEPQMANGEHKVKVGDQEMSVNELSEKYQALMKKNAEVPAAESEEDKKKKADELAKKNADEAAKADADKKNADEAAEKAKKDEESKKNALNHFNALHNAGPVKDEKTVLDTADDKVARGKARYGSN